MVRRIFQVKSSATTFLGGVFSEKEITLRRFPGEIYTEG